MLDNPAMWLIRILNNQEEGVNCYISLCKAIAPIIDEDTNAAEIILKTTKKIERLTLLIPCPTCSSLEQERVIPKRRKRGTVGGFFFSGGQCSVDAVFVYFFFVFQKLFLILCVTFYQCK